MEIEFIQNNVKGEVPKNEYEIISVFNISNAKEVLENFKNAILVFLKNKNLAYNSKKWEIILPIGIVSKIKQLSENDLKYDELVDSLDISIECLKTSKSWEWFSSQLFDDGFDLIVTGSFNAGQFINFIHCQNVPLNNISIFKSKTEQSFKLKTIKDFTETKILK